MFVDIQTNFRSIECWITTRPDIQTVILTSKANPTNIFAYAFAEHCAIPSDSGFGGVILVAEGMLPSLLAL